jgi:hypothetical protein
MIHSIVGSRLRRDENAVLETQLAEGEVTAAVVWPMASSLGPKIRAQAVQGQGMGGWSSYLRRRCLDA